MLTIVVGQANRFFDKVTEVHFLWGCISCTNDHGTQFQTVSCGDKLTLPDLAILESNLNSTRTVASYYYIYSHCFSIAILSSR